MIFLSNTITSYLNAPVRCRFPLFRRIPDAGS
jgi:hypothetical protein